MTTLMTIGYQGATPTLVLDALRRAEVDILVDVRAVSASRRPGFSKRQLSAGLAEAGIGYLHFRDLGTPSEGRAAARAGRYDELRRIYLDHLATPKAQAEMEQLSALALSGKRLCLLCFERHPEQCHRRFVAEDVSSRTGIDVAHLMP